MNTQKSKSTAVEFLSSLLIHEKQSKFIEYFLSYLSEVQYIIILLWVQETLLAFNNLDQISLSVGKLAQILSFELLWSTQPSEVTIGLCLVIVWIYLGLCCLSIGYLWFTIYNKLFKTTVCGKSIITRVLQLHFNFFFWIVNMVLMLSLSHQIGELKLFSVVSTYSKAFIICQVLLILLNYCIGMIASMFCFDPFCSYNVFASQSSLYQILTFLFKAVIAPLIYYGSYSLSFKVLSTIIVFAISLSRMVYLMYSFPFYYYKPMKLTVIFSTVSLWISFINVIAALCLEAGTTSLLSPLYLSILPLPLIIKPSLLWLDKIIQGYLTTSSENLITVQNVSKKLFAERYLMEKVNLNLNRLSESSALETYFFGQLANDHQTCRRVECFCKFILKKSPGNEGLDLNMIKDSLLVYFGTKTQELLSTKIKSIKDSNDMRIALSHLMLSDSINNLDATLTYLYSAIDSNLDLFNKIKKHILIQNIQIKLTRSSEEGDGEKLNIHQFVDHHMFTSDFQSQIQLTTKRFLRFWEMYKKGNCSALALVQISDEIERRAEDIDKLWNTYLQRHTLRYIQVENIYQLYLTLIRNLPSVTQKISRALSLKKVTKDSEFHPPDYVAHEDLYSSDLLTFHISMARERLGKILYVSDNIQNLLDYNQHTTIGLNLRTLLPRSFVDRHDYLLQRYHEKSMTSSPEDHHRFNGFMKTKMGYLMPCSTYISIFPYIQKELVYIGLVKVQRTKCEYIIIDQKGYIDSFTENIGVRLGLKPDLKTHIQTVCLDAEKLNMSLGRRLSIQLPDVDELEILRNSNTFRMNKSPAGFLESNEEGSRFGDIILTFHKQGDEMNLLKYHVSTTKKNIFDKNMLMIGLDDLQPQTERKGVLNRQSSPIIIPRQITETLTLDVPDEGILPVAPQTSARESRMRSFDSTKLLITPLFEAKYFNANRDSPRRELHKGNDKEWSPKIIQKPYAKPREGSSNDFGGGNPNSGQETKTAERLVKQMHVGFNKHPSERSSLNISISTNSYTRIERAIYYVGSDRVTQRFNILSLMFIGICAVLLLMFYFQAYSKFMLVQANISVLFISAVKTFKIIDLNQAVRIQSIYCDGLILDTRYSILGVTEFRTMSLNTINSIQSDLSNYNSLIRISLNKVESRLEQQLYSHLITIVDEKDNMVKDANAFDLSTLVTVKAGRLASTPLNEINQQNNDLNFILNNTLNDLLIASQNIVEIILDDNEIKFDYLKKVILSIFVLCCFIALILLAVFIYTQSKDVKERNRIIGMFEWLNDVEIEKTIKVAQSFESYLNKKKIASQHSCCKYGL